MNSLFRLLTIAGLLAFSLTAKATVTANDGEGNTTTLQVVGAKTEVTVKIDAALAPNYQIKVFYNTSLNAKRCTGAQSATLAGPNIHWSNSYAYRSMSGSLIYVSACVYNVTDRGTYLIREISDYGYVQGID